MSPSTQTFHVGDLRFFVFETSFFVFLVIDVVVVVVVVLVLLRCGGLSKSVLTSRLNSATATEDFSYR